MLKDARGFGYDIVLYAIAALRIGRGARTERLTTFLIGGLLAASGADAVADLWTSLGRPEEDTAAETLLSDAFALAAPGLAAATLLRFRRAADPLVKASWLNARNDVLAAFLTCASDVVAHATSLRWPGYALDLIGVVLSFQAAAIVLRSALTEPDACGPTALAEGSR
jgi:Co/Zn/Cd efflux system component